MGLSGRRITQLAARVGMTMAMTGVVVVAALVTTESLAQGPATKDNQTGAAQPKVKLGLSINEPGSLSRLYAAQSHGQKDAFI